MSDKKNIFIHIPKTGGTTINCVMQKTQWQTTPDFNYRHIIYETKRSNSADIFDPSTNSKYLDYNLFTMLRDPVDRLISEYYFIKDRAEFMSLLKPIPKTFKHYIQNKQTQNYMIGFLLGRKMYDDRYVSEKDLDTVLKTIEQLNIHVGIFDDFERSMQYFSSITGIAWPKKVEIKRKTINRPADESISTDLKNLIRENNKLDSRLYEEMKNLFSEKSFNVKKSIRFTGDEYDYIMKYTQRFNLLQLEMQELDYIKRNRDFFDKLNKRLHSLLRPDEGRAYVRLWNDFFIKSCKKAYSGKPLITFFSQLENEQEELAVTKKISKILNAELQRNKSDYSQRLLYEEKNLDLKLRSSKKSLWSIFKLK